jgi:hypothetical protein
MRVVNGSSRVEAWCSQEKAYPLPVVACVPVRVCDRAQQKSVIYVLLLLPNLSGTLAIDEASDLFVALLMDSLSEELYDAAAAGIS